MNIEFQIGSTPAVLHRDPFFGAISLITDGREIRLQSPWQLSTHFSFSLVRAWALTIGSSRVKIVKIRPRLLAGVRQQTFRIFVDDGLIMERHGH